jgi:Domain of unknown function (DUF1996)
MFRDRSPLSILRSCVVALAAVALLSTPAWVPAWAAPTAQTDPMQPPRPLGEDRGVFATVCRYSHEAPDDPIVQPGRPGASHLHQFFGNATTAAASTYDSLRAGSTTCVTGQDASGYWVPALYRNGVEATPTGVKVYYRAARHEAGSIKAFPAGFRVVAGDAGATSLQGRAVTFWACQGIRPPSDSPPTCPAEAPLTLHVQFPECWDGANIDSPDHKSHVAYGRFGACPADHPVALPALSLIVRYAITGDPGTITLASGGQFSAHADFFNAWDQGFLAKEVDECLNATVQCGVPGARPLRPRQP